jgi:hypothetical protein
VKIAAVKTVTHADRQKIYREQKGKSYREKETTRMRVHRAQAIPEFIGVDSEGTGRGKHHRAVLIGVGTDQYVAADLAKGLQWQEVFDFLYECYLRKPKAAYVGFYLSYDFNQWLKSLPLQSARMLLTKQGKEMRRMTEVKVRRRQYHPVRVDGWEIDMLGFKRLSIRPRVCTCIEDNAAIKARGLPIHPCEHKQNSWMHICDAGPFFQMGFKDVLDPKMWSQDPNGPICTPEEWHDIQVGKDKRATAKLDEEMKHYNALENVLLSKVMGRLAKAFKDIGISLAKDQWYGPGSTASAWLRSHGTLQKRDLDKIIPDWFQDACRKSYFGGWFEIFSHGIILGKSYNYDINNAYPYATTKLSHLCNTCRFRRGNGDYTGNSDFVLLLASVYTPP